MSKLNQYPKAVFFNYYIQNVDPTDPHGVIKLEDGSFDDFNEAIEIARDYAEALAHDKLTGKDTAGVEFVRVVARKEYPSVKKVWLVTRGCCVELQDGHLPERVEKAVIGAIADG